MDIVIYNIYCERYLILLLLYKELLFIYNTGCMFLFYKKEILLWLFVLLRKSLGKSWNRVENSGKVLEKVKKSPGKSCNLNQFFCREPCKWSKYVLIVAAYNLENIFCATVTYFNLCDWIFYATCYFLENVCLIALRKFWRRLWQHLF